MPRKYEFVVNLLLFVLVVLLILLIIWAYYILKGITPAKTAVESALNFT